MKIAGAMLGVLLVVALSAATASANLPLLLTAAGAAVTSETFTVPNTATVTRLTTLEEALEVLCNSLNSTAEAKKAEIGAEKQIGYQGPFHINFESCEAKLKETSLGKCTGLGVPTTGKIEVLGTAHLVFDSLTELGAAILFLLPSTGVHFECKSIVTTLVVVLGSVLCLVKPINTVTTTFELKCEVTVTPGDQKELKYSSGKTPLALDSTAGLFSSKNEGTEVDAGQAGTITNLTSALEVKIDA